MSSAEERKAAFRASRGSKDRSSDELYQSPEQKRASEARQKEENPFSSTEERQAARGSGVDKQCMMSGYTHLKADDDGPPEAYGLMLPDEGEQKSKSTEGGK